MIYSNSKGWKFKEIYSGDDIKEWVNNQRESGKKRTFEGKKFQFNNLELVEQDYKKRKANDGRSSKSWMYSGIYLYAEVRHPIGDPDEEKWIGWYNKDRTIFTDMSSLYDNVNWGSYYHGMK